MDAENTTCPLCGEGALGLLFPAPDPNYQVHYCNQCGLGLTRPFPSLEVLDGLYSTRSYRSEERRFIAPLELGVWLFRGRRLEMVQKHIKPPGRILDIGCARAHMLSMARDKGWDAYGLEYNAESARHAREGRGLDVRTGNVWDAGFPEGFFDVITIWHVIEHLKDPFRTIQECAKLLRPGGILVVSIPNFDSWQSRLSGRWWFHLDVPFHLYHFSARNFGALLEREGFRIAGPAHFSLEFGPYGVLQSLLNRLTLSHNLLYEALKTRSLRTGKGGTGTMLRLAFSLLSLPVMLPLSLVMSVSESIAGSGGSILFVAHREESK